MPFARLRLFLASVGMRLAVLQAVLLIAAFSVAGSLVKVSVNYIYQNDVRARMQAEAGALGAAFRAGGAAGAVAEIARAERRPGGLEYRLANARGGYLAGDLPPTGAPLGWTFLDWDDAVVPGRPYQDLLVLTERLPDGSVLTVGQDLSDESKLRRALKRALFWCAAAGATVGLLLSYLLARGALRRMEGVVGAARAVSAGRLEVRAPHRKTLAADEIDELGEAFNSMLEDVTKLIERVRWVSANIAHDLRTPLGHIRQKLERLRQLPAAGPRVQAAVQEVEADVDEMLRVFEAMLRLAEIESDPASATLRRLDLDEIAARIADAYRPDIQASGRQLSTDLKPAPAVADADLVTQALSNLVENALRHSSPGAAIAIGAGSDAASAWLWVRDNGPGIPPDLHDHVLRPFYRVESSRTKPGSGLGLAIVAAIAARHGAALEFEDEQPGLRVRLVFSRGPGG